MATNTFSLSHSHLAHTRQGAHCPLSPTTSEPATGLIRSGLGPSTRHSLVPLGAQLSPSTFPGQLASEGRWGAPPTPRDQLFLSPLS